MISLKNKNGIVCAGSSGIGAGIVSVLASYGANITTFSRNTDKLLRVKNEILNKTGNEINIIKADLSSKNDLLNVIKSSRERYGSIDFLVMNYGDPKVDEFLNLSDDDWEYNINMMLMSTINLTKWALEDMIKSKNGRIIYVTSMTTKNPLKNFAISNTLRSGIVALGKTLSIELAPKNITVNSISQGYFYTDRLKNIIRKNARDLNIDEADAEKSILEQIPAGRFGNPEEIGHLVAFLLSDDASYITGTNIQIDGGAVKSI
ncbi:MULTISPECIES: SDR family oxidoreductase [unclassified Acidiplasma]|uniref:SDR family oxidoreductase n=1 Tax=unclassified Acidiplasma TaxID=2641301 RepID=UPI0006964046|nr:MULTISPECIES: SDR family oxidoreductase [unclassified Acidiplasma]WMT54973.1 MAG: SDR family oxidoreductase [Acidiplasma sp.]